MRLGLCLLICSFLTFAGDAVIAVLESPIFSKPSTNSKILQYKRKGDKVYIHQIYFRQDAFEDEEIISQKELQESEKNYNKNYPDQYFSNKNHDMNSKFYKTLTRSGREGYILKDHVFLYFNDKRELSQTSLERDKTDYRIEEPLPKAYPLITPTGYRGKVLFSLSTPTDQPYAYSENIRDTGFNFNKEANFIWAKQVSYDISRRFFFGGEFNIMSGQVFYTTSNIEATENQVRIGIGPYLSYDVFRHKRHILNIQGSLVFNFYDSKEVKQNFKDTNSSSSATYLSRYFTPKIGMSYHLNDAFVELDLIIGLKAQLHSSRTYKLIQNSDEEIWKQNFDTQFNLEQSYFLGLQTSY